MNREGRELRKIRYGKPERRKPLRSRHGFTLVEMLVVATVLTFLLGLAAMVTHTLFRAQRSIRAEMLWRRSAARLSLKFREDAHAAAEAELAAADNAAGPPRVTLVFSPDHQVQYRTRAETPQIERIVIRGGAAVGRDTYRLPDGARATLELGEQNARPLLVLTVNSDDGPQAVRPALRFEALVGLSGGPVAGSENGGGWEP
jgi:prepilin-type N-terminal cleavage/methylation domain-containing protein